MKKGTVLDMLPVVVFVFVASLCILLAHFILTQFEAVPQFNQTAIATAKNVITIFDSAMLIVVIGAGLAAVLGGFVIRSHPAFFIVSMMINMIITALSAIFANIYLYIATLPTFIASGEALPMITAIMTNYPLMTTIIGFIVAMAVHAKGDGGLDGV